MNLDGKSLKSNFIRYIIPSILAQWVYSLYSMVDGMFVAKGVNEMRGDDFGALIITHYQRLLNYITPDVVHIMMDGRVVLTGNADLAKRLEAEGYAGISKELGIDYKEEV